MKSADLLTFISNKDLYKYVGNVLDKTKSAKDNADKNLHSNVIDPFSAIFDSSSQGIVLTKWLKQEKSRQIQKTLQNALGDFHQAILGSMVNWKNLGTGEVFDLKNSKKKIIAEVKNKYNTTKGNHRVAIYDDAKKLLSKKYTGYTAYYVEVIPKNKKTYNIPFTPPDNRTKKSRLANKKIRVIDGKSFYAMASGQEDALKKLYNALPEVIGGLLKIPAGKIKADPLFEELFDKAY